MSNRLAHRAVRRDLRLPPEPPKPPKRDGEEPQSGRPNFRLIWRLIWGLILGLAFGRIAWGLFA